MIPTVRRAFFIPIPISFAVAIFVRSLSNAVFHGQADFAYKAIRELLTAPERTQLSIAAVVAGILIEGGHAQTIVDAAQLHDAVGIKRNFPGKLAVFVQCILAQPLESRDKLVHRDGRVGSPVVKNAAVACKNDFLFRLKAGHGNYLLLCDFDFIHCL